MDTARHGRDRCRLDPAPGDQFVPGRGSTPPRKAPVDFGDVFGGPPRRLSGNEDGAGAGVGWGRVLGKVVEEGGPSSRRWSASVAEEKPVFGDAGRVGSPAARRRHLGDDFFSDIFRGNESAPSCPTPRRRDGRDLFPPSSPAPSRVVRSSTLPPLPAGDVFGGVSAVPAHLSYSSRIAKSFDYSSFRSPPGFSVCQLHEDSAPDVYSVPSSPMVSAQKPLKKASAGSKAYSGSGHFHFSIYKWASKGVTLLMPSNFKERTKGGSRLGAVSSQVWHREDHPLDKEDMFQGIHCFQNPSEVEDKTCPFNDLASSRTGCAAGSASEVTEALPAASDMKSDTSGSHVRDSRSLSGEEGKPRLKNLHELINENSEGEGDEVTSTRQTRKKEGLASEVEAVMKPGEGTAKVKQENRRDSFLDCAETGSQKEHSAPKILGEKALPARAKGRVKEYIKISKEEATEKSSDPVVTQTRGPKVQEKIEDCCTSANSDQQDNCNYVEASSIPLWAGQSLKKERKATVKGLGVEKVDGSCSPERSGASIPLSGSTPDSLDASFCNMEEVHYEHMEGCLIGELSQDHKEVTETDLHQEENKTTKMSDTRIQEWSKGKEGNIRSLLSTMQYVLWPGCGWKPVPLVDIIEGASVRRAYQRALLCLHPDKLQQKGAETHQKYIAEKVFDLLQESWDHFNSLSSL